jgi:hypothetical protein
MCKLVSTFEQVEFFVQLHQLESTSRSPALLFSKTIVLERC